MSELSAFEKAQSIKILGCYNVDIEKSIEDNDIKKSENDAPLGQTSSGKNIYSNPEHKDHSDFTKKDHQDAIVQHNINGTTEGAAFHREKYNGMQKSDDEMSGSDDNMASDDAQ